MFAFHLWLSFGFTDNICPLTSHKMTSDQMLFSKISSKDIEKIDRRGAAQHLTDTNSSEKKSDIDTTEAAQHCHGSSCLDGKSGGNTTEVCGVIQNKNFQTKQTNQPYTIHMALVCFNHTKFVAFVLIFDVMIINM